MKGAVACTYKPWVWAVRASRAFVFVAWLVDCGLSLGCHISGSWVCLGYTSIQLKETLPHAADDNGFGYDGPPGLHAGEEDGVGATCTKAWPVVVVVNIYIYRYMYVCVYIIALYRAYEPENPEP